MTATVVTVGDAGGVGAGATGVGAVGVSFLLEQLTLAIATKTDMHSAILVTLYVAANVVPYGTLFDSPLTFGSEIGVGGALPGNAFKS